MNQVLRKTIAENLQKLMQHYGQGYPSGILPQAELGRHTKLDQKTISNILNPNFEMNITIKTIEKLADYFQIEPYHLMIPLPIEELISRRIEKVIECYSQVPIESRENIARISESEMRYIVRNDKLCG
jgi:transcriptional regulator with XRE-family HTH domain